MRFGRVLLAVLGFVLVRIPSLGQDIVAAHAGVVHFSEGEVFIDDHALDHKPASYPDVKPGSMLRTEKGRAEVLLTPNVFLRLDEHSALRMTSNTLTDTRLDFLKGSMIIDTMEAKSAAPVVVTYSNSQVRFPKQGVYRLDSDTDALQAYSGSAEVTPSSGKPVEVDNAHYYFFALDLATRKFADSIEDEFYDWARDRSDKIAEENQLAAQTAGDPSDPGTDPYSGLGGSLPSYGISGGPSYSYPDGSYWFGNTPYNAWFPFGSPIFTTYIFPVVGVPLRGAEPIHSRWPHGTRPPGVSASSSRPELPGALGISHLPIASPAYRSGQTYYPGSIIPVRPPITGVGTAAPRISRPSVTVVPHTTVAAPHPAGHR